MMLTPIGHVVYTVVHLASIRRAGYVANRLDHAELRDNPHPLHTAEAGAWENGWWDRNDVETHRR